MQQTPSSERIHIGLFGCRNAGKSSLANALTGQELSIVSDIPGTTTDPVRKAMEILPLGPVVIIDTPGLDDEGMLGRLRIRKARQALNLSDMALLVVDAEKGMNSYDEELLGIIREKELPYVIVYNKSDLLSEVPDAGPESGGTVREVPRASSGDGDAAGEIPDAAHSFYVSAADGTNIHALREHMAHLIPSGDGGKRLVGDLLQPGDTAVLVCPIDESAPKGRLILPQQMVLRDVLDADALAMVTKETTLPQTLDGLSAPPAMVITDSQAFRKVAADTPEDIPLTSFSILMARYRGFLETAVAGVSAVERLKDGDIVLMAEGCTHHRQCNDIGTVKIPSWLRSHTGKDLVFETVSGREFPEDLSRYALIVHCGACMITERDVLYRMRCATDQGIPFTNYGTIIAQMTGTLERSLRLFPAVHDLLV